MIDELEVTEIPLQGGSFSWRRGQSNQRMTRLDKFLVTEDWDHHLEGLFNIFFQDPL